MIAALIIWAVVIIASLCYALSDAAKIATDCAWCKKRISGSDLNGEISQGICPPCRLRVEQEEDARMEKEKAGINEDPDL